MERCPSDVDFIGFIAGLRQMAGRDVLAECPHGGIFQSSMRIMAQSAAPTGRVAWLRSLEERAMTESPHVPLRFLLDSDAGAGRRGQDSGEVVLYFIGCLPYFDAVFAPGAGGDTGAIALATIRVLNAMGIAPLLLADERCCGHDSLWSGETDTFEKLAKRNIGRLQAARATTIVTSCAECARTLKLDYPRHRMPQFKVLHIAELLARAVDSVAPTPALSTGGRSAGSGLLPRRQEAQPQQRVAFHDPCRLSRHLKVFDAPRTVLDSLPALQRVELERSREQALCCGVSSWLSCDSVSKQIQTDRLGEAAAAGVDVLATACPKCKIHLSCAARDLSAHTGAGATAAASIGRIPVVRDVVELAAESLHGQER
jgi:Fe-S oxidoreductase